MIPSPKIPTPMIPLLDAQRRVARLDVAAAEVESVALEAALGRVLAEAPVCDLDLPPFDRATMDGFAVHSGGAESRPAWRIVGTLAAGATAAPLRDGEALRIMTGAPLPAGADAVVPIEKATVAGHEVRFARAPAAGENVHPRASDLKRGERPLAKGVRITAARVPLLATLGRREVAVHRRPTVAVLTTGDELVEPETLPTGGQIRDSNRFALAVQAASAGAAPTILPLVKDDPARIRAALEQALACDVVLMTGGSSVGDFDFSREVVSGLGGRLWFDQVAIKPGKPVLLFTIGRRVVFCLPGNPASAFVTFELLVRPLLERMAGAQDVWPVPVGLVAAAPMAAPPERALLQLAHVEVVSIGTIATGAARFEVTPVRSSGSGDLVAIARANALVHLRQGLRKAAGEVVRTILLQSATDDLPRSAEPIE